MVENFLENKNGTIATIRCVPEQDDKRTLHMTIDVKERKILENSLGKNIAYSQHASYWMYEEYKETQTIPEYTIAMWY